MRQSLNYGRLVLQMPFAPIREFDRTYECFSFETEYTAGMSIRARPFPEFIRFFRD